MQADYEQVDFGPIKDQIVWMRGCDMDLILSYGRV